MYLSYVKVKNFRQFGNLGAEVHFQPGISVLAGPNDSGKTTIIDAIRYVLSTSDREFTRVDQSDFHVDERGVEAREIEIFCQLKGLTFAEQSAFIEYLTPESGDFSIYLTWKAIPKVTAGRTWIRTTLKSGLNGDGPDLDAEARSLLACAYMRPLRDAEREMTPGRNSRLSKVLASTTDIDAGERFEADEFKNNPEMAKELSISALYDLLRHLVNGHAQISQANMKLNEDYLKRISLLHDQLHAEINFVRKSEKAQLQAILEKLELNLFDASSKTAFGRYGLGSNNLLYIACELLLLTAHTEGFPLLLIEEPEAHLHPQRQLQLMRFLEEKAWISSEQSGTQQIQAIITTHSPILASNAKVSNINLLSEGKSYPLTPARTRLSEVDYRFLSRFLDSTKANLFFAHGVIFVEGYAEELLLPTLARLLGRDLTKYGVSIVNIRGTGFGRYTRLFQQQNANLPTLNIPVSVLRDRDILPDCAPELLKIAKPNLKEWLAKPSRKLKVESDFSEDGSRNIEEYLRGLKEHDGGNVKTFISEHWTLEYNLIMSGLAKEMHEAIHLAGKDEAIRSSDPNNIEQKIELLRREARDKFSEEFTDQITKEQAVKIYQPLHSGSRSKAITAQYLAEILENDYESKKDEFLSRLPLYLTAAVEHVSRDEIHAPRST